MAHASHSFTYFLSQTWNTTTSSHHVLDWYCAIIVGNTLSMCGCSWLAWLLWKKKELLRKKLFAQLLFSLAISDVLFHCSFLVAGILDHGPDQVAATMAPWCGPFMATFTTFRLLSVFNELCVAAFFLLQGLRCKYASNLARLLIGFAWAAALLVGLPVEVFFARWEWMPSRGLCLPASNVPDWTSIICIMFCACISIASYGVVTVRSCLAPAQKPGGLFGSAMRKYLRLVALYPLNFVVTYAIVLLCWVDTRLLTQSWFFLLGGTLESFGGFLNVCTYALHTHYAVKIQRYTTSQITALRCDAALSYRVELGPSEVIEVSVLADIESFVCDSWSLEDSTSGSSADGNSFTNP